MCHGLRRLLIEIALRCQQFGKEYRTACLTAGREVQVIAGGTVRRALALEVTEDYALRVRWEDGTEETVRAGEVSVRGLYGYV